MQIWLDTIDCDVIAEGAKTGVISGVTTNPSILSHARNVSETIAKLLEVQPGPVAVQVTSTEPQKIIDEGLRIFELSPRMVIKVPINRNGLLAIQQLRKEKIPVLGTAILFPTQVLLASNQQVPYVAPYFGHMGDLGDAFAALKTMVEILRANNSSTEILVASLKQLDQIIYCASLGVYGVTIKPDLYKKLVAQQPAVESFTERFLSDWMQAHGQSLKDALDAPMISGGN